MISIGSAEDNDIVVDDAQVSRHHAELFQDEEGRWTLTDLDSTNGTFVNDQQIACKHVSKTDVIRLGNQYETTLVKIQNDNNDYSEQFNALKKVYDDYIKEKVRIQSSNQFKTRLFQSMPFAMTGIVGIIIGVLGKSNPVLLVIGLCITVCAPTIGIYLGAKQSSKIPQLLQELSNRFKIDYVCPKCGTFLGEIPWESLRNRKQCPVGTCKAKWVNVKNEVSSSKV